jgi:hypothetical protein
MMRFIALFAIAAVAFTSPVRSAEQMTAGELYSFCASTIRIVKNACSKYILGAVQGISFAAQKVDDKKDFCFPDNLAEAQLVEIFLSDMRVDFVAYPQDKTLPAVIMLGAAMVRAFPCQNTNQRALGKDA